MSLLTSLNGTQSEIRRLNCGINGVNREIFSAFAGVSGVNREIFSGKRTLADLPAGTKILDPYHSNSREPNINKFILLTQNVRPGHSLLFTEYTSTTALSESIKTVYASAYDDSYYHQSLIPSTVTFFKQNHSSQLVSALSPNYYTRSNTVKYDSANDSFSFNYQLYNVSVFPLSAAELGKSTDFSDCFFSGISSNFSSDAVSTAAANAKPYFTRTIGYYTDSSSRKRLRPLTVSSDGICDFNTNLSTFYFRYAFWLPSDTAVSESLTDGYFSLQF